jgi:uncharacterized protein
MIRSAFRPSDDATVFQLSVASNMMISHFLHTTAEIMKQLAYTHASDVANLMMQLSNASRIQTFRLATTEHEGSNTNILTYECDGYGSKLVMDDAK